MSKPVNELNSFVLPSMPIECSGMDVKYEAYYMRILKNLVNINSESTNLDGIKKCREIIIRELKDAGFNDKSIELSNGRKVLVFEMENSKHEIILSGHLDTVQKEGNGFEKIKIDGNRMYGPGALDMKGGLVLIINLLNNIKDVNLKNKIRVIITEEEELGSNNSKDKLKQLCSEAKYFLTYEPGLSNGNYVVAHSGINWIKISTKGKAAHAGLEHKLGINAVVELAKKIVKISALTDYSKGLTLSPGVISGGTKTNIVPDTADCTLDIRFKNEKDLKEVRSKIENIINTDNFYNKEINQSVAFTVEELAYLPAMPKEKVGNLESILKEVLKEQNLSYIGEEVGYGSDGNHVASLPINIIDGLGPYGNGMHTLEEFMLISSYSERLKISELLLSKLNTILK